jgi:hypothetical protein
MNESGNAGRILTKLIVANSISDLYRASARARDKQMSQIRVQCERFKKSQGESFNNLLIALEHIQDLQHGKSNLLQLILNNNGPKFTDWHAFREVVMSLYNQDPQITRIPTEQEEDLLRIEGIFNNRKCSRENLIIKLNGETKTDLSPLINYLNSLRTIFKIPNIFADGKTLVLEKLYVDLGISSLDSQPESTVSETTRIDTSRRMRAEWHRTARVSMTSLFDDGRSQVQVIFGDPGSGKSTLLRHILSEIGKGNLSRKSIPFLISLKSYRGECFIEHIVRNCLKLGKGAEELIAIIKNGVLPFKDLKGIVLLLDGLDQISEDEPTFQNLKKSIEEVSHIARVIITSRRAGYRRPFDGDFDRYEIMEMGDESIKRLSRNWFTNVKPQEESFIVSFQHYLFADETRIDMARNPTLLSLLCYLNEGRSVNDFLESDTRTNLYIHAIGKLMVDYKNTVGESTEIFAELERFSHWLFSTEDGIPRQLFSSQHYFKYRQEYKLGTDFLGGWKRSKLVGEWNDENWFFFTHLTFQEYLAAKYLSSQPRDTVIRVIQRHRYNTYWNEVWRFYAGLCTGFNETEGNERFLDLTGVAVDKQAQDIFGQCMFWLAPLCLEFGVVRSERVLKINLKSGLQRIIDQGRLTTRWHQRSVVRLDPRGYLQISARLLLRFFEDHCLGELRVPEVLDETMNAIESFNTKMSLRDALYFLEAIHHPASASLQKQIIEKEATSVNFPIDKMSGCGPEYPGPRNELLKDTIINLLPKAIDSERLERLIKYLTLVSSEDVAETLCKYSKTIKTIKGKLKILDGLIEMRSSDSVEIAESIRDRLTPCERWTIAQTIRNVSCKATEEFLTRWLESEKRNDVKEQILDSLAFIGISEDLELPERYFKVKCRKIRASAIRLYAARGRERSVPFLKVIISEDKCESDVIAALSAAAEYRLDLSFSSQDAFKDGRRDLAIAFEIAAVKGCADTRKPSSVWVDERVECFNSASRMGWLDASSNFAHWISALVSTSHVLRLRFSEFLNQNGACLGDDVVEAALANFEMFPNDAPVTLVHQMFRQKQSPDSRAIAMGILAAQRSPLLIKIVDRDPVCKDNLLGEAVDNNLMIFREGWLDPSGILHKWQ